MTYCTDCIHYKVCGNEGVDDIAMTFCADKQTDGDLISRKDTIEWLKKVTVTDGITFETGFKQILTDIKQMPSAEKTAVWVGIDDEPHEDWECDHCGFIIFGVEEPYRFCPNCGAKMKGAEE